MSRFTVGARVRVSEPKSTGRVGTVIEVLPQAGQGANSDHYRIEFNEGDIEIHSDMELSPAGSGAPVQEDVA